MIKIENYLGVIEIHQHYFSELIGQTVTSCFGVAGMANSGASQGLRSLLFKRKNIRIRALACVPTAAI